jgi:hypothetical protein
MSGFLEKAYLFIAVCALALHTAAPAFAQQKQQQPAPVAEKYRIHDEATFAQLTEVKKVVPFNKAFLEFFLLLPKDWETIEIAASEAGSFNQKIIGDVARFQSEIIGTARAKVVVQFMNIEREIDARSWLRHRILGLGYAPDGEIIEKNKYRASAGYAVVADDGPKYIYSTAQMTGNAIFFVTFEVPLRAKEYLGFLQTRVVDSFILKVPKDEPVEEKAEFSFKDALKIGYPKSWAIISQSSVKQQKALQLVNQREDKTVEGLIQFNLVKRRNDTTLLNEIQKMKKYFQETVGVDIKEMTSKENIPFTTAFEDRFVFKRYETYTIESNRDERNKSLRDLHFVTLGDKDWYIFIFLMTATEKDNFMVNAHNVRSFERILETIR